MTKSKTIIATLGIVAGLGAAALPLASYAAEVSGNVDVIVEVQPAIAMSIAGDNDSATGYGTVQVKNPAAATQISGFDASSYLDTASNTVVSSSKTELLPANSVHGTASDFRSVITVYTNNVGGYTLGISGIGDLERTAGDTDAIPATGLVKAGTAGWGYAVDTAVTADATTEANYAHADAADILTGTKGDGATTSAGEVTTVFYGVSTANAQPTGVYKDTITYTATTL